MSFEFINNSNLNDDATRKRIRRHAAVGRNRGKRISRPSRKDVLTTATTPFRVPLVVQGASEAKEKVYHIERPVDDGLFFPGILPGESKGLVKEVISFISSLRFSPELNNGLDYGGLRVPECVRYMFVDEACFHSTMSTALLYLDNMAKKPRGKLQAMRHASHTFRLLKQKLCGQDAITDSTIAAVVSMAQYEHNQNHIKQGLVHVQGLWQIAQLRGGISNLIRSPSGLGQKMLRVDLEYSLQLGSPTLFRLEEAEMGCKSMSQFPSVCLELDHEVHPLVLGHHSFNELPADFRGFLVDVLFLASSLNNAIASVAPKMSAIDLYQNIILFGYRLVKLKPLGLPLGTPSFQNRLHLGLTAFLATFLQGWDNEIAQNDLLSQSILAEVQTLSSAGQENQETLLWLLFIGAASSCLWKHPVWVSTAKHTLQALKIESWEDVKKILTDFPWVNAVHDTAGQALWYRSQSLN